jgi:hypothetical protein
MLNTLQNTPLWVYAVFLLLCYFGIKALSPTRESKTSLLITPPILLGWSLYSLDLTFNPLAMVLSKACASGFASGVFCGRSIRFYQALRSLMAAPA